MNVLIVLPLWKWIILVAMSIVIGTIIGVIWNDSLRVRDGNIPKRFRWKEKKPYKLGKGC